jgi:hypothetical protein
VKFIWGAKKLRKPEKIAFFETIPFSGKKWTPEHFNVNLAQW